MNRRTSRRIIGITLIFGSMLIVLGYSAADNLSLVNAVAPPPAAKPLQTNLQHAPTGTAYFVWDAKQLNLKVKITMSGLASNSTAHAADLSLGSCLTGSKQQLAVLSPVMPTKPPVKLENSSRTTIAKTTIPLLATGIPQTGWFINIYNSPTTSVDKTTIACGDITNFNTSPNTDQFVNVALGPTKDPNQAANGIAMLSIASNQLTVIITMSGLLPNSTHQAGIFVGTCKSQQAVKKYILAPVLANQSGSGTSTTKIPNVASITEGLYIDVYLGATAVDLNTQAGLEPLACGDIVPPTVAVPPLTTPSIA